MVDLLTPAHLIAEYIGRKAESFPQCSQKSVAMKVPPAAPLATCPYFTVDRLFLDEACIQVNTVSTVDLSMLVYILLIDGLGIEGRPTGRAFHGGFLRLLSAGRCRVRYKARYNQGL
jgi:hypothetical protein